MNVDPNAIISATAVELTRSFFSELKKTSVDFLSKQYKFLSGDFSNYLSVTYNRCNFVRTIINKDRSFEISDIYVPGKFKNADIVVSDVDVIQEVRDGVPVVILGFGGIGKTVFMKHLWRAIFLEPMGKIPVYLELRRLNGITDVNIRTYIRRSISPTGESFDADVFEKFLQRGQFVFIFDGFDELNGEKRDAVSEEIINLSYSYPKNGFVLSSRHDDRFSSWQRFKVYRACSFSKTQVLDLVGKINFDKDTKKKFTTEIIQKKYQSFQTFLSTPLLTLMMLMTFAQFAEVPDKRHIFYRYAFMTLYSWHDSSKESFNREKQSGLVLDQFEKAFSIFCLITYLNREYDFDEARIRHYIGQIKKYVEFDFDEIRLQSEMTDTVNLIYRDGDVYLFTHRSFQEYFAAYAIINYFPQKMIDIVPRVFRGTDVVLSLMYEMNSAIVDDNFILPLYREHKAQIDSLVSRRNYLEVLRVLDFYYIGSYHIEAKGKYSANIYGHEIRNSCWFYILYLKSFFESLPEVVALRTREDWGFYETTELDEQVNLLSKRPSLKGRDIIICWRSYTSELFVRPIDDVEHRSLGDAIAAAVNSGEKLPFHSNLLFEQAKAEATEIKAMFVCFEKILRRSEALRKTKEKGIDDLLL